MAQILVRNLPDKTVALLKERAKRNKRSLEAEVREVLDSVVNDNHTPEYRQFLDDLANGVDKNTAFLNYSRKVRAKQPFDPIGSVEEIRQEREERDARFD